MNSSGWLSSARPSGKANTAPHNGTDADAHYFKIVADYIHLNPARAGIVGGEKAPLVSYKWSSLPCYQKGNGPGWLVQEKTLKSFELAQDGRGRRAYVAWLEARAANDEGKIDEAAMEAIRRGWYLGKETFKDRLLKLMDKSERKAPSGRSRAGAEIRDYGEKEATRIVIEGLKALGAPTRTVELSALPKSDERKVIVACLLREKTSVSNEWIASRMSMGHPGSVSRMISHCRSNRTLTKMKNDLSAVLIAKEEQE